MAEAILDIRNLRLSFGSAPILDGVELSLGEGSFTSLVGPSGSGKTVLALSICRLIRPKIISGGIYLFHKDGHHQDILNCSEKELLAVRGKEIAYIFQDAGRSLNPVMSIGAQIDEVLRAHQRLSAHESKKKTLEALAEAALRDPLRIYRSYPHELSGGMKQRAMIAMALASKPRILIADEPTTALDPTTELEIMELLKSIREKTGLSVLFITHDMALASAYSDAIHVIDRGKIAGRDSALAQRLLNANLKGVLPKTRIEV